MKFCVLFLFGFLTLIAQAQDNKKIDMLHESRHVVTMPAGKQYQASPWKQFWWGKHWRKEWLTPITFPVIDLDTTNGGLTAKKEGGGKETKSLRLLGENGKEYVLRSLDKNLDILVPEEYKRSFIEDIVNDQVSNAHPYSAMVVAKLSAELGFMHTNPVIVYVPDNPRLSEFATDFAGKLCLFEERPSGAGWKHTNLTANAYEIINSEKLFDRLQEDNSKSVDQKAYLQLRLFDIVINDWDRHYDQWLWTAEKTNEKTIYHPFARDRDQAFSRTDGVNMFLLTLPWGVRHIRNMDPRVRDVIGSTQSGVFMDKKFLNELSKSDWEEAIAQLQRLLTDEKINNALQVLPPHIYTISHDFLYKRLRARRDELMRSGMKYYKILNKQVDVIGTDGAELINIDRKDDHTTELTLLVTDKKETRSDTTYHRVFNARLTKKIFVYGLGGDDVFNNSGTTPNHTTVRSFGNNGNDTYQNVSGHGVRRSPVYDTGQEKPDGVPGLIYHTVSDTSVTNYHWNAFRYDWWMPTLIPGYNADDGFVIGAGITYKRQQWNKSPFGWMQTIGGDYAAATGAFSIYYKGDFTHTIGKWNLLLDAEYKAPSYVVNFYGYGNDTKLLTTHKDFYRTRATKLLVSPALERKWAHARVTGRLLYSSVKADKAEDRFISKSFAGIDSSVFSTKHFASASLHYNINTTDSLRYPTRGMEFQMGVSHLINLSVADRNYTNYDAYVSFYFTPAKNLTIAHRTGAALISGQYEFYQANTLGGHENLRGFWRTRFSGKGSFFQNTDVRLKLADVRGYVLRGTIGVYGFFDDGRVWLTEDHSNTLHTGYGGGILLVPYSALAINIFYASSKEINTFTIRTGFLF